jgi:hypothetical protein
MSVSLCYRNFSPKDGGMVRSHFITVIPAEAGIQTVL